MKLLDSLFDDADMQAIFSDETFIQEMLVVEAALAKVQGELGVIPKGAAKKIATALETITIDRDKLLTSIEKSSIPTIELVRQIREQVGGEEASYVHWGATTQDIMDTALVLQMRAALEQIAQVMAALLKNLAKRADEHRDTLMAGRTHSQQALPIPFGLKVATWIAPLLRHQERLSQLKTRLLVVQFGGAAGTLASLGDQGLAVQEALARELDLGVLLIPYHTQRDSFLEVAGWLSLVSGSLAKMAQDIILMAQTEVGEILESDDPSRGGSSTMPQKRNPVISELIIGAARTNATLLSALHHAQIQEHERATHGWQMEWLNLPQMFTLTAAALTKALFLSQNMVVNVERMRENVAKSNGLMLAEAVSFALTPHLGRAEAKKAVKDACHIVLDENRHLVDVLREQYDIELDWDALKDESAYLGSASAFIDRILAQSISPDNVESGK